MTQINSSATVSLEFVGGCRETWGARKVRAYCPVSFALKLALFCLILGLVAGVWLS